ncbi:MAG TPA: DUF3344 domain-containing protein [Methanosarcinales archaeon]|nr:DUF3344 domain-containing protein [Methanosarcinales archaeon]
MKKIALFIFILLLVPLASAGEWRGDGTPLYVIAEGSIHGGVYVGGGHGLTYEDPYVEYFDLPGNIEYARLYVPVWNYNEGDWIEVSINGKSLGRSSEPSYVAAWGICDYVLDVTNELSSGMNTVSVTYHNTNGAPYSIVLVAVYNDTTMPQTRFWIAEGNHALSQTSKIDHDEVIFRGDIPKGTTNATLWTMMIAGNEGEIDKLYFNSNLLGEDVGRRKSGAYFDLDSWDVTEFVDTANNSVLFERGGESYIHPFNAVFFVEYMEDQGDDYIEIHTMAESKRENVPRAVVMVLVISMLFLIYRVRSKK